MGEQIDMFGALAAVEDHFVDVNKMVAEPASEPPPPSERRTAALSNTPPRGHLEAMRNPAPGFERALVTMLRGAAEYAETHRQRYESPLSCDGFIGEAWHTLGQAVLDLLNGETGHLDCATVDGHLRALFDGGEGLSEAIAAFSYPAAPDSSRREPVSAAYKSPRGRTKTAAPAPAELPMRQLDERQRELLALIRVDGQRAIYTGGERIPDWPALKVVMVALGGKWRTGGKSAPGGFVFADDVDVYETIALAQRTGEILDPKLAGFFPTPESLAKQVVRQAMIQPCDRVLEPSAGVGAIAIAARDALDGTGDVHCVEFLPDNAAALRKLGFGVTDGDFLALKPKNFEPFDRVVMNPPFGNRADIHHIRHAMKFLRPGGRLVAIASAGVKFRDDQLARDFRAELAQHSAVILDNPEGSFLESGTGVATVMISLKKEEL